MNLLLIYMVKVAVYLAAFYLVYSLMLSRDTSYGRNRAFILFSLFAALLLPLLTLQTIQPRNIQFFGKLLSEVFISSSIADKEALDSGLSTPTPLQIIYTTYTLGVVVFLFKSLTDLLNLIFLILRSKNEGTRIIKFKGFNTAGFSAMGHIFINTGLNKDEAAEIIKHEQSHLQHNHFLDILFIEIVKAFQWFNPAIHLLDRSLRAIHEYQADHGCLSSGIPLVRYQTLLLNQVFKSRAFNLINSFSNPSLIKKRMIMMTRKRTSSVANMKLLFVIPVMLIVIFAISSYKEIPDLPEQQLTSSTFSQLSSLEETEEIALNPPLPPPPPAEQSETITAEAEPEPFVVVEEMPVFPGGDLELLRYIGENTQYPESAKEQNIQGRVIVRFCVTAKGAINQVSVLKGVSPDLDMEAIRVVQTLPAFVPGKQDGKAVPVWYMVPINFALK